MENKLIPWLIRSSEDPKKISLSVKGILLGIAPVAVILFGWNSADINSLVGAIAIVVEMTFGTISAFFVLWGLLRKFFNKKWAAE